MPPKTTQEPEETPTTPAPTTPAAEASNATSSPHVAVPSPETASAPPVAPTSTPAAPVTTPAPTADKLTSPLPSALQPTDTPFNSLQPSKDVWQMVWKGVIGLNVVLAALFVIFLVLKLTKLAGATFSAGAVGTPFWLLPTLLILDMLVLVAYFVVKHPKVSEVTKIATWVGVSFGAVFVTSIAYVIVQSMA